LRPLRRSESFARADRVKRKPTSRREKIGHQHLSFDACSRSGEVHIAAAKKSIIDTISPDACSRSGEHHGDAACLRRVTFHLAATNDHEPRAHSPLHRAFSPRMPDAGCGAEGRATGSEMQIEAGRAYIEAEAKRLGLAFDDNREPNSCNVCLTPFRGCVQWSHESLNTNDRLGRCGVRRRLQERRVR
jgi:hypothetical protein